MAKMYYICNFYVQELEEIVKNSEALWFYFIVGNVKRENLLGQEAFLIRLALFSH
jgi:hypothetical protein